MATQTTNEKAFLNTITKTLETFGYQTQHDYPLLTRGGYWQTGSTAKGWPDLFAIRPPRVLAIEVKGADRGYKFPDEQRAWLSLLASIPSCRAWLVTPSDPPWTTFVDWVRHPYPAPSVHGFELMEVDEARNYLDRLRRRRKNR